MQSVAVFLVLVAAASANSVFRVPSADSAVISSQRLGGNFAYSVQENAAYGVFSPVVSHVTSPVATTYAVQQQASVVPQANFYTTVQQPATVGVVSTGTPAATTGAVQQQVQYKGLPLTQQVATGYGYPYTYTYGAVAAPATYTYGSVAAPTTYTYQSNVVGVEAEKEVAPITQVQAVEEQKVEIAQQPQALTYTVQQPQTIAYSAVQQPQTVGYTAVQQPQTVAYTAVQQPQTVAYTAVQQPQTLAYSAVQQPQVAAYTTVQQPQVGAYTVQQQGAVVASGSPVATTYAVQQPISVVQTGTPASTYKTVAGASPLGFNNLSYGYYPYGYGYNSYKVVV